jgi:hypothetical protein
MAFRAPEHGETADFSFRSLGAQLQLFPRAPFAFHQTFTELYLTALIEKALK